MCLADQVRHFKLGADDVVEASLRAKQEHIANLKEAEAEAKAARDQPFPAEVRVEDRLLV